MIINGKEYTQLSHAPHPEFKAGDKFIILKSFNNSLTGEVITLDKESDSVMGNFHNNVGEKFILCWDYLAPYPEEPGDKKMSYSQFDKLRYSFLNYEDLEEMTEKLEEIMNIYYMEDDSKYYDAKKLFEDIKEKMNKEKQKIMEMQL